MHHLAECKTTAPTAVKLPGVSSSSRDVFSVTNDRPRRRVVTEYTSQTMGDQEEHPGRPVIVTCAHQPKRREVIRSWTGRTISRYRIGPKLGSGVMGEGASRREMTQLLLARSLAPIPALRPPLPSSLARVIERALEGRPSISASGCSGSPLRSEVHSTGFPTRKKTLTKVR